MSDPVLFVADEPLNCNIRIGGPGGGTFAIVADRKSGTPWPANLPFPVPAGIAEAFERDYGPRPDDASVTPGAALEGRIRGLRRA